MTIARLGCFLNVARLILNRRDFNATNCITRAQRNGKVQNLTQRRFHPADATFIRRHYLCAFLILIEFSFIQLDYVHIPKDKGTTYC